METIDDYFNVKRGKGGYIQDLNKGKTPLVTARSSNNGIACYVDIEPTFEAPLITVERVTGKAFVQPIDFATVPDDISVLIPKNDMNISQLYYIASRINFLRWRFTWGRKLSSGRLKKMEIDFNVVPEYNIVLKDIIPKNEKKRFISNDAKFKSFNITEIFTLKRGDFHALDKLGVGEFPTVSRITENNGIVGYYEKPDDAKVYLEGLITVSTTTGDAFVQLHDFIATDNVVILKPKNDFRKTTLFFIASMINREKWRWSYGRQCYKTKLSELNFFIPVKHDKEIDEDYMEKIIKNCYGWDMVTRNIENS